MALFGTDGIRGRAGEGPLAPPRVRALGAALGLLLRREPGIFHPRIDPGLRRSLALPRVSGRTIVLGRDPRESGPAIERALLAGMGVRALRVGVLPTPGIAWLARRWKAALGVVISASHNPAADNGIKIFSGEGFKIPDAAEGRIEEILATEPRSSGPSRSERRGAAEYLAFLRAQLPPGRPLRGRRVVVDCAHGATSAFAPRLLRSAGAEAVVLHADPDGRNINRGAGALHPGKLAGAVRRHRAALGVAFDGDGDRCIVVDERGEVRDGDFLLAVASESMRAAGTLGGRVVVSTVMANFGLEKFLADRGLELRRVKVGDKFVAEEMMRSGARLGGEQSGHVIFLDAATAGDGMLTALRLLRILLETGRPLSELCAGLVKAPQVLLNVPVRAKPDLAGIPPVAAVIGDMESKLAGTGRVLVRYSGTENLCRVMVEGSDARLVRGAAERIAAAVKRAVGA